MNIKHNWRRLLVFTEKTRCGVYVIKAFQKSKVDIKLV